MRIVLVCSELGYGGTETQVIALSRALAGLGHVVAIYTLNHNVPRASELDGSGVRIISDQKRTKVDVSLIRRLRRFLVEFRADIAHGFLYDGDFYARLACAGTAIPALNSERDDNYSLNVLQRIGLRLTRGLAAGVVANSYAGAAFAQRLFGLPSNRIHVVWNGIALDEVDSRIAACNSNYKLEFFGDKNVRMACLVGAICPQKDYFLAIDVARRLIDVAPDWRVLFIGGPRRDSELYATEVKEYWEKLGLSTRVHFAGIRRDIPEILSQCDVLFSTSLHEGFPNAVLEAMAARIPAISTEYSDIRRILPREVQIVRRRQPEAVVDSILGAWQLRAEIAREQRRWVEAHCTVLASALAMAEVYSHYSKRYRFEDGSLRSAGRLNVSKKPKICFVTSATWPVLSKSSTIRSVGGAEVQQVTLARALARAGYPVAMICLDYGQPDDVYIDGIHVLKSHRPDAGIPMLRFIYPRLSSVWRAMLRADADIYYQRCAGVYTGYVAAFAEKHGRRFVFAAGSDRDFGTHQPTLPLLRDRLIYRWGLRHAHAIVVQNESQAESCVGETRRNPRRINSCYDPPASATSRRDGYVLWVSSLLDWKRPEMFLELARRLPEFRFRLVGGADDKSVEARIAHIAADLGNVEFTGFVPFCDIDSHFNEARVLVNTSLFEGFPNTFLQAWARGIPTVSFVSPIAPETPNCPVITCDDMDDMVDKVRALMAFDDMWEKAGEGNRRWFAAHHSVESVVAEYGSLFSSLAGNGVSET